MCKINFATRRDVVSQQRIVRPFLVSCYSPGTFVVRPHQGNTGKMSSSGTVEQGTIIIIIIRVMSNASQKMVSLIGHITFGASTTKEPRSADMCSTLSTRWMAGGADKIKFNKECFCILNMVRNTLKNPHQPTSTTKCPHQPVPRLCSKYYIVFVSLFLGCWVLWSSTTQSITFESKALIVASFEFSRVKVHCFTFSSPQRHLNCHELELKPPHSLIRMPRNNT